MSKYHDPYIESDVTIPTRPRPDEVPGLRFLPAAERAAAERRIRRNRSNR